MFLYLKFEFIKLIQKNKDSKQIENFNITKLLMGLCLIIFYNTIEAIVS